MDSVLITGTVGAGKTTVAAALSDLAAERSLPHAVVDTDEIRRLRPPPAGDPFQQEVMLANLAAMAANFRAAGAELLIVAGVIEQAADLQRCRAAVGRGTVIAIRLTADPEVLQRRLRGRHDDDPDGLAWHAARTVELTAILDAGGFADLDLDTTGRTPQELAERVLARVRPPA